MLTKAVSFAVGALLLAMFAEHIGRALFGL